MEQDNEQQLIFSGRNVEEALKNARDKLNLDPYADLDYEVIDESKKRKFLLFGGSKERHEVKILIKFGNKSDADTKQEPEQDEHNLKKMVADVWDSKPNIGNERSRSAPAGGRYRDQRRSDTGQTYGRRPATPRSDRGRDRPDRGDRRGSEQKFGAEGGYRSRTDSHSQPQTPRGPIIPVDPEVMKRVGEELNLLFQKMGLNITVGLEKSIKNESIIRVNPEGPDKDWLLSQGDEGIHSFEEIISKMVKAKFGEEKSCRLYFVGKKKEFSHAPRVDEEAIKTQVLACLSKIKETGQPETIGPMNAYERRLVHTLVAEAKEGNFVTESVGTGHIKKVTIRSR